MSAEKKIKQKRRSTDNIHFSIGAKLITIISIIVVLSLGSITALVSWLVYGDLWVAAEENNFEMNRRSALEAEATLASVRSNSRILIQTVTAAGTGIDLAPAIMDSFFEENRQIAALFFTTPTGTPTGRSEAKGASPPVTDRSLINRHFFNSWKIDAELADLYRDAHQATFRRAVAGETVLLNATPHFTVSVLALFFPWRDGAAGVLFSPTDLNDTFGFGINQSYLLNDAGDILVHPDFQLVRTGANMAGQDYIREIGESSERNRQRLIEVDSGLVQNETNVVKESFIWSKWEGVKRYVRMMFDIDTPSKNKKIRLFLAYTKLNTAGAVVITSIEYDKVFQGIAATTRRNLYLTGAVLSASIILIWFFSKSISVPLKSLARVARIVEGGTFEVDLKPKSRDEIGLLIGSFKKMCLALGIFGRFTNRDIAIQAMRGQIRPGGLPKHATIFFSDIRGFTAKSENFTKVFGEAAPDHIVSWLNAYFTRMVECVEKTNGVVDKFIGDAVMAHWGTAFTSGGPQQDAFNCVASALMMRKALYYMNKERRAGDPSDPPIQIGCGINTGIVTAGQIGSDLRMEYTVIGDPVNLASRVEALTKPLGADILITEDTWRLVGSRLITEEMPSVTVKGKEQPVRIFAVVNIKGVDKGPQTLDEVRKLLGIATPDIAAVDLNEDEKKYKIGGEGQQKQG